MFEKDLTNLMLCVGVRMKRLAERTIFEPLNISGASFKILAYINNNGQMKPGQLVKELGSTKSNITQRINLLVKSGWLEKIKTDGDGRSIAVRLTKSGQEKLHQVTCLMSHKHLSAESAFTKDELKQFHNLLKKINNLITQYEQSI